MGMTDKQFDAFIRELVANLEKAFEKSPDNEDLKAMIERLKDNLRG